MKYSVSELYLFLNKYVVLKKEKKTIILVNQIIRVGHGNLKVPWARKLDSRDLVVAHPFFFIIKLLMKEESVLLKRIVQVFIYIVCAEVFLNS